MLFKKCPRCGGDLLREEDEIYIDLVCIQCGFRRGIGSQLTDEAKEQATMLVRWLQTQRPEKVRA